MRFCSLSSLGLFLTLCLAGIPGHASQYQWSVPVDAVLSTETSGSPRAWLWIPPTCKQVRAVILGQHNLLEETIFDNPVFRQAAAENDMAIVWVSPAIDGIFRPDQGAGQVFEATLQALAQESGYSELAWAPIIPIGHSAMAGYPYQFAAWNPERTLVAISIKGTWPDARGADDFNFDNSRLNGVPLLFITGEYEDADGRAGKAASFRQRYPLSPLTMVADPGAGHFDFHDRLARYMGLYLHKVARYRLPEKSPLAGPVPLKPIDPAKNGWLYDRFRRDAMPKAAPAPLNQYTGPKDESFWAFDGELARATDVYTLQYRLKKPQLLGYVENGELQPQNPQKHEQVVLKFAPQPDGQTFKISGSFIDTVPEGRPTDWTGLPTGSPIKHSPNGVPIDVEVTTGPLKKVADDTFAIQFGRIGFDNGKRSGAIWFQATHDGDDEYKRAAQQAALNIPIRNTAGTPQNLTFDSIPNQPVGVTSLPLRAVSSAGVPVSYYVQEGPADVEGTTLKFSPLPPRAKTPLKVTVVAYQWGRATEPKLQSATPIARTFYLLGAGQQAPDTAQLTKENAARAAVWEAAAQKIAALPSLATTATPAELGRVISFNFAQNLGLAPTDLAGATLPVSHWNNVLGLNSGTTIQIRKDIVDSNGNAVPLSMTITGGATAPGHSTIDFKPDEAATSGAARLFNGVYDQTEGTPTTITIFGIPFARYDVVFYRYDDGPQRAGKFQIGNRTLYARGGKGAPDGNGANYVTSTDPTLGQGTDIEPGNTVRFSNLIGNRFTAAFQAVFAGDPVQRNKVAGFQIIERK